MQRLPRRTVLAGLAATAAFALPIVPRSRAESAPASAGAALDYPKLQVTITDQVLTVASAAVPAGLVLLSVTNQCHKPASAGVMGPPPGQRLVDFMASSRVAPLPADLYQAAIPGGPSEIAPGQTSQAVIVLPPGEWAICSVNGQPWAVADAGAQRPLTITAVGESPTEQAPPATTVTVTQMEYAFLGLDAPIPAGPQFWKVHNYGTLPHMLALAKVPADTTLRQVMDVVNRYPSGNAPRPAGMLQDDAVDFTIGGVLMQSAGQTVYPQLDLEAGRYLALCLMPDPVTGKPCVMHGMVSLFDVGGTTATG